MAELQTKKEPSLKKGVMHRQRPLPKLPTLKPQPSEDARGKEVTEQSHHPNPNRKCQRNEG